MYKYILFDLDGTLTDPKEGITKSVQYALKSYGIDVDDPNELICFIGPPLAQSFEVYYDFSHEEAMRAVDKYRERFATIGLFENSLLPGTAQMLAELKQNGQILAVASSKPTIYVRRILEHFDIMQYFDAIVGSNMDGSRVDKAEVIQYTLAQLGLKQYAPENTVMVGDRSHDVDGAARCGLPCIGVRYGYAAENELETAGAINIADDADQLTSFLLS